MPKEKEVHPTMSLATTPTGNATNAPTDVPTDAPTGEDAPEPRYMKGEVWFSDAVQIVNRKEGTAEADADRTRALSLAASGDCVVQLSLHWDATGGGFWTPLGKVLEIMATCCARVCEHVIPRQQLDHV